MKIKAVIFDLDGTLYDNSSLYGEIIVHNLFHLGMLAAERLSRHHMSGRYYGGKGATYRELFRRMGACVHRSADSAAAWYWRKYMPLQVKMLRRHHHPKPWVIPTLKMLREKGIKLACFSEYAFIREKLTALGISPDSFDYLVDAPTAGGCKPCRKAFIYVAAKLDVHPSDILVIGDRDDTDGAGADSAGMQFHLVDRHDTPQLDIQWE